MVKYDVNIDLANETKREMVQTLQTDDSRVLNRVGAFASLFDIKFNQYKNPVMVLKTEEPGSKQLIATQYDRIEGVCYDMINHLINDCIVMGATPLTVQDAIICGKMDKDMVTRIVKAIAQACQSQECILTGGETSEQPGVLNDDTYILTSSIVGIVEKEHIIDGSKIKKEDVVISIASNGIHTNGYTLVRKIMKERPEILDVQVDGKPFIDAVLVPHRCYYQGLKGLFKTDFIHGLAHITGGGICENLNRILTQNVNAKIDLSTYQIPEIFKTLKTFGDITDEEMLRTFNMGAGMVLVTEKAYADHVMNHLSNLGFNSNLIGTIEEGNQKVIYTGNFSWN